jgi:hypothetical protein
MAILVQAAGSALDFGMQVEVAIGADGPIPQSVAIAAELLFQQDDFLGDKRDGSLPASLDPLPYMLDCDAITRRTTAAERAT